MRTLRAIAAIVGFVAAACQASGGVGSTAVPSPTRPPVVAVSPTAIAATAAPPSPTRGPCLLDTGNPMSEMTAGRCIAVSFRPPFAFDAPQDWTFSGLDDSIFFLWPGDSVPSEGEPLNVVFYRFGGFVTRAGCDGKANRLKLTTAAEVVAWLSKLPGLKVATDERTVDGSRAWLIDLEVTGTPACVVNGKPALQLWAIDLPTDTVFALGENDHYRFYLIQTRTAVVMMAVQYWDLVNRQPYFDAAEKIFASLSFE